VKMQINYDPQADTLYIQLQSGQVDDTIEASKYIYIDIDEENVPLGVEILFARQILGQTNVDKVTINLGPLVLQTDEALSVAA